MTDFLVTGATGFVGSWLTRHLLRHGHRVRVLCRRPDSLDPDLKVQCDIYQGDILDYESLLTASSGAQRIYHLAGLVAYRAEEREAMEQVNVEGTRNILKACVANHIPQLVYMSSVVAIGASLKKQILNEESPYDISSLNLGYFETKKKAEELVMAAHHKGELKAFVLNPSTIYGPGDFKKGSRKFQLKAARGQLQFYTKGGVSIVSIEDVVEAALRVTELGRPGERYILSGDNITIKKLFQKIAKEMKTKPPFIPVPTFLVRLMGRFGLMSRESTYTSTMYHWFDNSKAQRELDIQFKSAHYAIQQSTRWLKSHDDELS